VENRPPATVRETGTFKFFDRRKRFGFIIPNKGSGEVFIHEDDLPNGVIPRSGDQLEFQRIVMPPPLKPKAANVVIVGGRK